MKTELSISKDLSLPVDVMTLASAVLGVRGSGKTTTGVVAAEELLGLGHQVVVIDPLDVWWGLKASPDESARAFQIPVLGGAHADLPLSEKDGGTVADLIVDERLPMVLSLRHFESQADMRRFVTEFAQRLFFRKGQAGKNSSVLVIIDEASLFCPQRVEGESAKMVGAIQKLVRQGRSAGIGVMLIDQRPASVNKDVLTQAEMLVVHRVVSPQDRAAVKLWVEANDTENQGAAFMTSLAGQKTGQAWFWCPHLDLFKQVQVRNRRTFDSSATPKPGQAVRGPANVAAVDIEKLKTKLTATIEKARADDPRELKRRIAELEKAGKVNPFQVEHETRIVEVPTQMIEPAQWGRLVDIDEGIRCLNEHLKIVLPMVQGIRQEIQEVEKKRRGLIDSTRMIALPSVKAPAATADVPKGEIAILTAVAQTAGGCTREQLTVLTGYKRSTRDAYIQRAKERGLVDQQVVQGGDDFIVATTAGVDALGENFKPLPVGDALREHWLKKLPEGEAACLQILVDAYPAAVDRETISRGTNYKRSTRDAYLQRLSTRRLITSARDGVKASPTLFD